MRAFNQLVFDQTVRGTTEVVSSMEYADLLGKADDLVYEVEVDDSSGTTPTLTLRHLHSVSGRGFIGLAAIVSGASIASPPYRNVAAQAGPLGGLGQVGITLAGTNPVARVRVWATGRTR